jgi:5-methylcytosine-specific restriction enzyme B
MKEDAFGSPEGSVNFRINAALTTTPAKVPDIIKDSGVELPPWYKDGKLHGYQTGPVYVHLKALAAKGKIVRLGHGRNKVKYALLPTDPETNGNPKMKELKALLEQFRQVILYGPPGTGKTREAKHLALALLSGKEVNANSADDEIENQLKPFKDANRFNLVVFHPAYEYEQFVGGIEPEPTGQQITFKAKAGVFTRLCRKAENDADKRPAVLIIDEINRGNLPKLLGELVYALEYRDHEVRLPFDDGQPNLVVPKNLFIIATMNSADRSIGHIDVAIRRRFGLYPLQPNSDVVREVWSRAEDEAHGKQLADLMKRVNEKLRSGHDAGAATECGVGQSYFLPKPEADVKTAKKQVEMKWKYQVQPLLREYEQLLNLDAHSLQEFVEPLEKCLGQP